MGSHGRGTVDHFDLHGRVDFVISTLSKAIGVKEVDTLLVTSSL